MKDRLPEARIIKGKPATAYQGNVFGESRSLVGIARCWISDARNASLWTQREYVSSEIENISIVESMFVLAMQLIPAIGHWFWPICYRLPLDIGFNISCAVTEFTPLNIGEKNGFR